MVARGEMPAIPMGFSAASSLVAVIPVASWPYPKDTNEHSMAAVPNTFSFILNTLPFPFRTLPGETATGGRLTQRNCLETQRAVLRAGNDQAFLNQEVMAAQSDVGARSVAHREGGAVLVGADIAFFAGCRTVPGIQVRIGDCFTSLVGQNGDHGIDTGVAVGALGVVGCLAVASAHALRAMRRVSDKRILDVLAVDASHVMEAAVLAAERGAALGDLFTGHHMIESIGLGRKRAAADGLL